MTRKAFVNFYQSASVSFLACAICFLPVGAQAANTGGYKDGKSAVFEEEARPNPPLDISAR